MGPGLNQLFPTPQVNLSVGVDAPADLLWKQVSDSRSHVLWNRRASRFEKNEDQSTGSVKWHTLLGFTIEYDVEVCGGGDPKTLCLKQVKGPKWVKDSLLEYTVESVGRNSRVRLKGRFSTRPFFIRRLHGAFLSAYHGRSLIRLKEMTESLAKS